MMENQEEVLVETDSIVTPSILKEVLVGLSMSQKAIPPKFLYDKKGSEIFQKICELKEYYPTRAENQILKTYAHEMARLIGPNALIIEPGSGVAEKVKHLLLRLTKAKGYVPIEISKETLNKSVEDINQRFPKLQTLPVWGDFSQKLELPISVDAHIGKKVIFFPGSTIGNFNHTEALEFLKHYGKLADHGGGFLIGVDLKKDRNLLVEAYDDPHGVTAAFNLNLLERLNREASASFDLQNFSHQAIYNQELCRVEMHLVSNVSQLVKVNQTVFRFKEGETIHTENSYKYSVEEFCELCSKAKMKLRKYWKDKEGLFCMYYFERE